MWADHRGIVNTKHKQTHFSKLELLKIISCKIYSCREHGLKLLYHVLHIFQVICIINKPIKCHLLHFWNFVFSIQAHRYYHCSCELVLKWNKMWWKPLELITALFLCLLNREGLLNCNAIWVAWNRFSPMNCELEVHYNCTHLEVKHSFQVHPNESTESVSFSISV